mgnify:CR=1 FL=1
MSKSKPPPPPGLLDLYSRCSASVRLRAMYAAYVEMVTAHAISLSHLRQLDTETPFDGLIIHLEAIESFAVVHLQRAIEAWENDE